MTGELREEDVLRHQRDQMLKLVTKGFYKELTSFGVEPNEIVRVASHLLDNLMSGVDSPGTGIPYYNSLFDLGAVEDRWSDDGSISVQGITIRSLEPDVVPLVADWLGEREVRESFVPAYPDSQEALRDRLLSSPNTYFEVIYEDRPVGIVGGENPDECHGKMEMKKLVGADGMRGKGIGKRATFGFLYYAFALRGLNKVYIHSRDINMRNINLNSRFGFEIEGIFHEDLLVDGRRRDVVRMSLLKDTWSRLFGARS